MSRLIPKLFMLDILLLTLMFSNAHYFIGCHQYAHLYI